MNEVIFSVIQLLCGLAFFLYGMEVMSGGLKKMAGGKLEQMLKTITSNPFTGILLGAGITIAIQSSSAMTVMLVGLVNSSIMELGQTISMIFGSNIGSTVTAWITSLSALDGDNFFIAMLKPANFSGILAFIGILMYMTSKKPRRKDIGIIFIGFAVLMFGMELMSNAVQPLSEKKEFQHVLTMFRNPFLGVLVGTVFTGVIQSSAASIGILQAFSLSGSMTYSMAIPIILGLNIGTCATALISSIGVNKPAKRVAIIHVSLNTIGTIVFMLLLYGTQMFVALPFMQWAIDPFGIAFCHMVFNVINTMLLLPFPKILEKIAFFLVPDDQETKEQYSFIDERLLKAPSFAISECYQKTAEMADMAKENIQRALSLFDRYDEKAVDLICENEERIDKYEDRLGTSLVRLSSMELSAADGRKISKLLHTIGDFERIGDHAVNILKVAQEIYDKRLAFSDSAAADVEVLKRAVQDILRLTVNAFAKDDVEGAKLVEPLEQVIDRLISKVKTKHVERLQRGTCTIEMGFVLSDLLNNIERVSDHCSNIAVAMIEVDNDSFYTHEYLEGIKTENDAFKALYQKYKADYALHK